MISINDQRVLIVKPAGIDDITKDVNQLLSGTAQISLAATTDYIYFGSFLPFNQKYFDFSLGNGTVASLKIEVYDGSVWQQSQDIIDYTENLGAPFSRSGTVQFNVEDDESYGVIGNSDEIPELSNYKEIYSKSWVRFSFDQDVTFSLRYIGSKFASHADFVGEYPLLRNEALLNAWEENKTTWKNELIKASEYVIQDLKKRKIIVERSQVVEASVLFEPTIHRAAMTVFSGLGVKNYMEEYKNASESYLSSMDLDKFEQDANGNGQKDRFEQFVSTSRASR